MNRIIQSSVVIAAMAGMPLAILAQQSSTKRPLLFYDRLDRDLLALLGQPVIQEELEISISQYERYSQASRAEANDPYHKLSEKEQAKKWPEWVDRSNKAAEKILEPDQLKRLQQISLQQRGVIMFQDPEIAKTFNISEPQFDKIYSVLTELRRKIENSFPIRQPNGEIVDEHAKERAEAHQVANEKVRAILTEQQKQKWTEMLGPEFKKRIWGKPIYVD